MNGQHVARWAVEVEVGRGRGRGRGSMANKAFNVFICGRQNLKVAACSSLVGLCGRARDKTVAAQGEGAEWGGSCNMLLPRRTL